MSPDAQAAFRAALTGAGVPGAFTVTAFAQVVPRAVLDAIAEFVRVFDRVTARPAWQQLATRDAPPLARAPRTEACFFSAWDIHLPPGRPADWRLIEFNDNGSGMLLAAHINAAFHALGGTAPGPAPEPPLAPERLLERIDAIVADEALRFFGRPAGAGFLIVDAAEVLAGGRFRAELDLLGADWRRRGRTVVIAAPEELHWDGTRLSARGVPVEFVVNRCTDFHWEGGAFAALRAAYASGTVYVAPNPFSYATRSDKATLALLSRADRDAEAGITAAERAVLRARVPETLLLDRDNVAAIAARKHAYFFKPAHGFASHGVHAAAEVGAARLRHLLRNGVPYVAQALVPKATAADPASGRTLWTDLRVWAWRGEILMLSGRASTHPHRVALAPPGGWIPTYAGARGAPDAG